MPTNKPVVRKDEDDWVFKTAREKYNAVTDEVEKLVAEGRPVLVGTTTVEISELVSRLPMVVGKGRNPLHDFGGSCTYLKSYALLALLGLTADMDVDGDFADSAEAKPAKAAPKPAAKIEGIADKDQPLSKEDRDQCLGLIKELTPDNLARFCTDFRRDHHMGPNDKVAPALTAKRHQHWMNTHLKNYV